MQPSAPSPSGTDTLHASKVSTLNRVYEARRAVHLIVYQARRASVATASTRRCGRGARLAGRVPKESLSSIEATRLPGFHPCMLEDWRPAGVEAREDRRLEALRKLGTLGLFRTLEAAGVEALEEALAPLRFSASFGRYFVIHSTALAAG